MRGRERGPQTPPEDPAFPQSRRGRRPCSVPVNVIIVIVASSPTPHTNAITKPIQGSTADYLL